MFSQIKSYENNNEAIVDSKLDDSCLSRTYFNLVKLKQGENYKFSLASYETVNVVMTGTVDIVVDGEKFNSVGVRKDIWSGQADSVYAPIGVEVEIHCVSDAAEIAVAGGHTDEKYTAFRITPEEVDMVDVGSNDTHSRRRIYHILGQNGAGRSGKTLVSELYCDPGCWSGYPPHKHDDDREGETDHEEVYHYRFNPGTGFGGQFCYDDDGKCEVYRTENGDTVLISAGYHPTVTSPGHQEYIFTILVGKTERSLVQHFHADQQDLMDAIPGIASMREKFK